MEVSEDEARAMATLNEERKLLDVQEQVIKALGPLDKDARRRVVRAAAELLGIDADKVCP